MLWTHPLRVEIKQLVRVCALINSIKISSTYLKKKTTQL